MTGGNNASTFGVACTKCHTGSAVSDSRTQCVDISTESGGGVSDPAVVADVLEATDNVIPRVPLDLSVDQSTLDDPVAYKIFLDSFRAELAESLGVPPSSIVIARQESTDGRRRVQNAVSTFDISFALEERATAGAVFTEFARQLADPSSQLRNSSSPTSITGAIISRNLTVTFSCTVSNNVHESA